MSTHLSSYGTALAAAMLLIIAIDYRLGPVADSLNAYEIVRRTFRLGLPLVSERFVVGQTRLGAWALPVAWVVWVVEANLGLLILRGLWGGLARVLRTWH